MEEERIKLSPETLEALTRAFDNTKEAFARFSLDLAAAASDLIVREQYRFPRSKRKRIRKKWAKRPENYRFTLTPEVQKTVVKFKNSQFIPLKK